MGSDWTNPGHQGWGSLPPGGLKHYLPGYSGGLRGQQGGISSLLALSHRCTLPCQCPHSPPPTKKNATGHPVLLAPIAPLWAKLSQVIPLLGCGYIVKFSSVLVVNWQSSLPISLQFFTILFQKMVKIMTHFSKHKNVFKDLHFKFFMSQLDRFLEIT